ncbi:MAG TPA: glutamate--tRNA ligase [Prolixibacteraceae bacterium]|nr:glutamate--tRNA ligase [Prolixibacteraceae bacterium]HPS12590.1 glutamate--tRNA ligase [Prolixibacteraceae bacterium]
MIDQKVRVRFAPSPTGPLHIGGVRTALFNYLFAKKHGGDFLLRIEDTDQTRFVPGAEEYIMESLEWCGIKVDEGIREGGSCGPYRQSERKAIYKKYADQLIESGNAYYAFDTPEELDRLRSEKEAAGETFIYNSQSRVLLKNSLTMSEEEVNESLSNGVHYVIRFRMPDNVDVTGDDLIRGQVTFNTDRLDDKVLFKSDGMPTYHLANVVDDHLMSITHVIRGEEWLSSMPLHILLYEKLGWESPKFAHLPLILKPIGKGKLSKRDGDKMGFPVFPLLWTDPFTGEVSSGYREDGYFPEAFINMLALLGWNPGTEQEIFSMEELIHAFDLDRVGKSGSKFDPEKTKWFNHQYMLRKSDEEISEKFRLFLLQKGIEADSDYVFKVVHILKERAVFIPDLWEQGHYFFETPQSYDEQSVKKRWKEGANDRMQQIFDLLSGVDEWDAPMIKEHFSAFVNEKGWGFGIIMNEFRICLVGAAIGPDLFEICEMIGKEETLNRIRRGLENIHP